MLMQRIFCLILMTWSSLRNKFGRPADTIPEPSIILRFFLALMYNKDMLKKLEFLCEYFFPCGLFRYGDNVYVFKDKYCKTVIQRLDKGADSYLANSPLSKSFLGSSHRSPDTRRQIAAIFRKSNMDLKGLLMIPDIEKMIEKISKNTKVNVNDVSMKLALDIVGHVLLDLDLHSFEGRQDGLIECITTILHRAFALGEIECTSKEFSDASANFDQLTECILKDSLRGTEAKSDSHLQSILHNSGGFDEAKDNLKLFLMAGSETTAATLPILLYVMAAHPDVQTVLQSEADEAMPEVRKDPGFVPPKLESVLKEVLRLYPIAPYISRHADCEIKLGNVTVPEKTDLRIFMWGFHRSKFLWENSKEFNPRRFQKLDSSGSQSYFWIPFGAGSRVCIGQYMAWVELRVTLVFLLHNFTFFPIPETPELGFCVDWEHAVVHPDKDIILGVEPRLH